MLIDTAGQLVKSRQSFFKPVSLQNNIVVCGDDRDGGGLFIHWFGGILNPVYNLAVLQEVVNPHSVSSNLEQQTAEIVPRFIAAGIKGGVHSDETAEGGTSLDLDRTDGKVGCGYAELRQAISVKIHNESNDILQDLKTLMPELLQTADDLALAQAIVEAHGLITQNSEFFSSGRQVVLTAAKLGATTQVVRGQHVAKDGIINMDPQSALERGPALAAGLGAYCHDQGSLERAYDKIGTLPFDKKLIRLASVIDALGTMRALGVETVAVRPA